MLFFITHSKLFSVNRGPQNGSGRSEVRGGLDPALLVRNVFRL